MQRFSGIFFWLFLFFTLGKKKARTYWPVEHRCGILSIAVFGTLARDNGTSQRETSKLIRTFQSLHTLSAKPSVTYL